MTAAWEALCRAEDFEVVEAAIEVRFPDGRKHRVSVDDEGHEYRLSAVVARARTLSSLSVDMSDIPLRAWQRNRSSALVGFCVNQRGWLLGESWVPKAGLTAEEFQLYVRTVAVEADRFEYV